MAVPGFIEGRSVLFADPMPERAPIPKNPAGPGRWSVGNSGLVLWDVVFPSGTAQGRAVGPLAGQPQVIVALRGVNRPDIRAGWMTFTRDFQLVGSHVASDYYLGLRFQALDGLHYGWWDGSQEAFEPRPGQPLAAGQTPTSLGAYVRDGEMVVSWNRSLTGYELQSTPSLTAPTWAFVSPGSAGRVVLPLSGEGGYLRLRGVGEPRPLFLDTDAFDHSRGG